MGAGFWYFLWVTGDIAGDDSCDRLGNWLTKCLKVPLERFLGTPNRL
jgi:hypothetical protein